MIPRLLGRASARAAGLASRLGRRRTLAAVGGVSLALGLGVVFLPWLFPASAFRPVSRAVGSPTVVGLVAAVAGLLGASALGRRATGGRHGDAGRADRSGGSGRHHGGDRAADAGAWLPDCRPERAHYDEVRTAGAVVDHALGLDPGDAADHADRRRDARNRVREVAVAVIADADDCDRTTAIERVQAGTWTDDPRAAAFLGGPGLAPLRVRIRDWASGERFERWAEHAVAAVAARAGVERSAFPESPPDSGERGTRDAATGAPAVSASRGVDASASEAVDASASEAVDGSGATADEPTPGAETTATSKREGRR